MNDDQMMMVVGLNGKERRIIFWVTILFVISWFIKIETNVLCLHKPQQLWIAGFTSFFVTIQISP